MIEHAFVIEASNRLTIPSLPTYIGGISSFSNAAGGTGGLDGIDEEDEDLPLDPNAVASELDYKTHKEQFEKEFIIRALKAFKGRINQTAFHANIAKKTLLRKLQKYAIRAEDYRA